MDKNFPGLQSLYRALIIESNESAGRPIFVKRRRLSSTADAPTMASRLRDLEYKLKKGRSYRITCQSCEFCPYGATTDNPTEKVRKCSEELQIAMDKLPKDVWGSTNPTVVEVASLAKTTARA